MTKYRVVAGTFVPAWTPKFWGLLPNKVVVL
jgi:hypothetical protein